MEKEFKTGKPYDYKYQISQSYHIFIIKQLMIKCNEDSCSDEDEEDQIMLERGLVIESMIEVDHLICSICHHIVWQPVACGQQSGCQNAFCSYCIKTWLQKCNSHDVNQSLCPQCKRTFVSSKIPPIMKSVLEAIVMKCPNFQNGCKDIFRYSEIGNHLQKCGFKIRRCRGCHSEILIKSYQEHINHCEKYLIQCNFCGVAMPKVKYLQSHIIEDKTTQHTERSYECYENQINSVGSRATDIEQTVDELNNRCDRIQNLTKCLILGEPLDLLISFYTTFHQHFTFPNPTLIKPSFNQIKQKFDFLHFYIANPIYTNSIASIKWGIKINKMMGNILIGFCSNMNINSLDYIVNKYGQLKRKDIQQSKYKIVRKNEFSFSQGDVIRCRYLSLLKVIRIENQTKRQMLQLGCEQIREFDEGGKIYVFISMDTLNDSLSFLQ